MPRKPDVGKAFNSKAKRVKRHMLANRLGHFGFFFAEVIFAFLLNRVSCGAFNSKAKRVKTHMLANRLDRFRFPSRR